MRSTRRLLVLGSLLVSLAACTQGTTDALAECTTVRFEPAADTASEPDAAAWLRTPFPSDHRRGPGGTIDVRDFPNPSHDGLLDAYAVHASDELDGFGTNSPIYLRFTAPIDLATLPDPDEPAATLEAASPLQLIDVTVGSPEYGQRRPLRWSYFATDGKFVAADTLAVAPLWGFPLRERTTYAFVVTSAVADAAGEAVGAAPVLAELVGGASATACAGLSETPDAERTALSAAYAPLRAWLADSGPGGGDLDASTVAAATVFTTQSITAELAEIYRQVQEAPAPALDPAWAPLGAGGEPYQLESFVYDTSGASVDYWVMQGRFASPNYQTGTVPYAGERDGGGLNRVDGVPAPDHVEMLRFVLTIPADAPGTGCLPVVQYSHGTGGSAYSLVDDVAGRNAARGLATIGVDQPLHGARWSGSWNTAAVELYSFNFLNPAAARTLFRQSAVDTFSLTRFVASLRVAATDSPTQQEVCFDPERIAYFGHSQGGLTGALAAAFEEDIGAWVLSGAGGGMSITVVERKDEFMDAEALLETLLQPAPGERFSEMHPVTGLIQLLSEVTDPINYSPWWLGAPSKPPTNVLLTSGTLDAATPHRTAAALAVAARVPIVAPLVVPIPGYEVLGLAPAQAPVAGNVPPQTTAGFMQWTNDLSGPNMATHFLIFHRPEAIRASIHFLESFAGGAPELVREPSTTWR